MTTTDPKNEDAEPGLDLVQRKIYLAREIWKQVKVAAKSEGINIPSYVRQCVYRDLKSKGLAK